MSNKLQSTRQPPCKRRRLSKPGTTALPPILENINEKIVIKTALAQHFAGESKDLEYIVTDVMHITRTVDQIKRKFNDKEQEQRIFVKSKFQYYCDVAKFFVKLWKIAKTFNRKPISSPWKNFAIDFFHITRILNHSSNNELAKRKPEYDSLIKWLKAEKYLKQSKSLFENEISSKFLTSTGIHIRKQLDINLSDFLSTGCWFAKAIVKVKEVNSSFNGDQAIDWLFSENKTAQKMKLLKLAKQQQPLQFLLCLFKNGAMTP